MSSAEVVGYAGRLGLTNGGSDSQCHRGCAEYSFLSWTSDEAGYRSLRQ
jgi:hypothetical protein